MMDNVFEVNHKNDFEKDLEDDVEEEREISALSIS